MMSKQLLKELQFAQDILSTTDTSIVAIKNSKIIGKKTGTGLRPFMELIDEIGNELSDCVIGDRILGKASALLCTYSNIKAVYSPQGTKTAIAFLVMHAIPCQIDHMIPYIQNRTGDDRCPFEQLLENINDPQEAYNLLQEKLMQT